MVKSLIVLHVELYVDDCLSVLLEFKLVFKRIFLRRKNDSDKRLTSWPTSPSDRRRCALKSEDNCKLEQQYEASR